MRSHNLHRGFVVACGIILAGALLGRLGQAIGGETAGLAANSVTKATAGPTSRPAPTSDPTTIVVATYNMNFSISDKRSLDEYVRIIRECAADIVAIQEGNPALYAHLKKTLAKTYPHTKFYRGPAACGFGWLSKKPLLAPKMLPKSAGWFGTAMVQVKVAGRAVQLVNTHLMPTVPPRNANASTMLNAVAQTEPIRAKEIRFIHSKLPSKLPVVMLGDFNCISAMNATTFLAAKGFIDSFASVTAQADSQPSWHWPMGQTAKWQFRLDYVWHDRNFKTLSSRTIAKGPSDHYPVVSKLELLPQPASQPAESAVPRAVTRLLGLLKADDPNARFETAIALGRLGEPEAIWPLIEMVAGDPNRSVRLAAVEAIVVLGGRNVDANQAKKSMAFLTLVIPKLDLDVFKPGNMMDTVAFHANDRGHVHQIDYRAFQAVGAMEGVPLKVRWRDITMGEAVCRMLVATGGQIGFTIWGGCLYIAPAEEIVNGIHGGRRERYRRAAIRQWSSQSEAGRRTLKKLPRELTRLSFADIDLRDVVTFLHEYSEIDIRVDWKALLAVGIKPETKLSMDQRHITVERAVAFILKDLGGAAADSGGLDYLVDDDVLFISTRKAVERRMAARAGGAPRLTPAPAQEEREAVARLIAALKDKDPLVRRSVAVALGRIGAGDADDMLAEMAKSDGDPSVRKAAAEAVLRLRGTLR